MIDFLEATEAAIGLSMYRSIYRLSLYRCATPSLRAFSPSSPPGEPSPCPSRDYVPNEEGNLARAEFQTRPKCFEYPLERNRRSIFSWKRPETERDRFNDRSIFNPFHEILLHPKRFWKYFQEEEIFQDTIDGGLDRISGFFSFCTKFRSLEY